MLFIEAAALRADGDFKDRRRERGSSRTIKGEHECVQGQGQGLASQCKDAGENDGGPDPDDDCNNDPRKLDELPEDLHSPGQRTGEEEDARGVLGDQGGGGDSAGLHL